MATRRTKKERNNELTFIADSTKVQTRKKGTISPQVILAFLSKNPHELPAITEYGDYMVEDDIFRCRLILWNKSAKTYKDLAKKLRIPNISEAILVKLMKNTLEKKYKDRKSPPFSAAQLCGATMRGNDGLMYVSVKNKSGVCLWKSVTKNVVR